MITIGGAFGLTGLLFLFVTGFVTVVALNASSDTLKGLAVVTFTLSAICFLLAIWLSVGVV